MLLVVGSIFMVGCDETPNQQVFTGTEEELYNYPPLPEPFPELNDHDENEIASFDSEDLLKSLSYRDVRGKAEVIYDEEEERIFSRFQINGIPAKGENCWPNLELEGRSASAVLKTIDFTPFDGLKVDVRNNTNRSVIFNILIMDFNYVRYENYAYNLPANSDWITLKFDFDYENKLANGAVPANFTLDNIGHIEFWFFNVKEGETPIVIDLDRFGLYMEDEQ